MAGREQSVFNGGPILAAALPALAPAIPPILDDDAGSATGMSAGDGELQYDGFAASSDPIADDGSSGGQVKAKQKRNKPTLSCLECVERKTKCDRARPCLACVKRQSSCEYTPVANLIASGQSQEAQYCLVKSRFSHYDGQWLVFN
jgi:hypothetical protein